jgi:uncharacterized OB-fold protein
MNKVNYKQFNITKDERRQEQKDVIELRRYILSLKERDLNGLRCEGCGATDKPLDIHHKRYGIDVNYYDLELLCPDCHVAVNPSRYDN